MFRDTMPGGGGGNIPFQNSVDGVPGGGGGSNRQGL